MQKANRNISFPPERMLLGPGPSNVHPRVYQALASPIVGHLDPYFFEVMDDTKDLLRQTFRTKNDITFPIAGTGMAGMEAAICNVVEEGDEVVVCVNGFFGARMSDIANRNGGKVTEIKRTWGESISPADVKEALSRCRKPKAVALVHAETSTGVLQPLSEISKIAHDFDALLIADTVTSLGGCELGIDSMGIDVAYSGSQKCLNCPPGLSPITVNEKTMAAIRNRRTRVRSWYFDIAGIEEYWSQGRAYHHTGPISMVYAFREALKIVQEEGLENRWTRHRKNCEALVSGLESLGLTMLVKNAHERLPSLTAVRIPESIADTTLRGTLLNQFNIEIGGGLGELKGRILRIGLMGLNSSRKNIVVVLDALEKVLNDQGYAVKR